MGVRILASPEPENETRGVVTLTHVIEGVVFTATGPQRAVEQTVDKITRALDWYDALASEVKRQREEKRKRLDKLSVNTHEELIS